MEVNNKKNLSNPYIQSLLQALLVTFLWSTSWVLIKIGLNTSLPPITFAGLRYFLAFLCLVPFVILNPVHRIALRNSSRVTWLKLILLGFLLYTLTQGAQFISLAYLPAATLTLMLNIAPIIVALLSGHLNKEMPSLLQWGGILVSITGVLVYFYPLKIPLSQHLGLLAGCVSILANSGSSLLGRKINLESGLPPILITSASMGIGGILLLTAGVFTQGFGNLTASHWLIISWLAVVNTAIAFTLWNNTLRILTAVESSIINNLMLPQIAILAWWVLDEPLNFKQVIGIIFVGVGTLIVQLRKNKEIAKLN